MSQETKKVSQHLPSLVFLRASVCPENVKISGIVCNGVKTSFRIRVSCEILVHEFPYCLFPEKCKCCGSSYGTLALWDGDLVLACIGMSCMRKNREFIKTK